MTRLKFFAVRPFCVNKPASGRTQAIAGLRRAGALFAMGAGLAMASGAAWAHFPIGQCKALDETTIQCKGGFSDGSDAPGLTLDVISYDEKTLVSNKLDKNSTTTFKRPPGPFYILFDAGAGHVVEIDHTEIDS